jgi:hypothetical protein
MQFGFGWAGAALVPSLLGALLGGGGGLSLGGLG